MEKRTLLFLSLSFLIVMLYPYLLQRFGFIKTEQPHKNTIAETPVQPKSETLQPRAPARMGLKPGISRELTIETDLYRAVLTTRGAAVAKWELKNYKEDATLGQAKQLYQAGPDSLPPLSILTGDQRLDKDLREAIFVTEGGDLTIDKEHPSGTISLFYIHPESNQAFLKRLTFHYGRYDIEVEAEVSAEVPSYEIHLGTNFGISDWGEKGFAGFIGPISLLDGTLYKDSPSKIEGVARHEGPTAWVALQDKYFVAALIPSKATAAVIRKENDQRVTAGAEFSTGSTQRLQLYAGPKEFDRLSDLNVGIEKTIDFGWFIFGSLSLVAAIAKPLFHILQFLYHYTHNYGAAIILLTIGVRGLFIPLAHKSYKSMKAMQALQPEIAVIQKKHKDDRERMNREMMELYKKHKANPLGGCLPVILQIPVFVSLFNVLYMTIELRQAPFILWVTDLSNKDPYYVLPVLMGATMVIQQKMQPTTMDPMQAKIFLFMPVFFTIMFLSFPSGLVLYWLTNNLLTITQQYVTMKYFEKSASP